MKPGRPILLALLATASAAPSPLARAAEESPAPEVVVATDMGSFTIRLLPEAAPLHARRFLEAVRSGEYDRTTFHRIIPERVIQGGDPISRDPSRTAEYGRGGMSRTQIEHSDRPFVRGAVVAARCPSDPDTDGAQFFVLLADAPELRGQYTLFGEVVSGMETVDAIGAAGSDEGRPRRRIEMAISVRP
jgi:peptidyl-prolyl cis-trans isomerase B (cyclophilin B)